jgi:hypothetical protein
MNQTKRCTACGLVKQLTDFYADPRNRDGRYSECKDCVKARRKRNREQAREAESRYRQRNREAIRERQRERMRERRRKV